MQVQKPETWAVSELLKWHPQEEPEEEAFESLDEKQQSCVNLKVVNVTEYKSCLNQSDLKKQVSKQSYPKLFKDEMKVN